MAIEQSFPKRPIEVFFYGLSFLQKWELLLKEDDRCKMEQARGHTGGMGQKLLSN